MSSEFDSLYYATYAPKQWGEYAWKTLYRISAYVDLNCKAKSSPLYRHVCLLLSALLFALPCRRCVRHFDEYSRENSWWTDKSNLTEFLYDCETRISMRKYKRAPKLSLQQRQSMPIDDEDCSLGLIRFLHFVALTYPNEHKKQHKSRTAPRFGTSQDRRKYIRRLICDILPKLLPCASVYLDAWCTNFADKAETWNNRMTVLFSLYLCAMQTHVLESPDLETLVYTQNRLLVTNRTIPCNCAKPSLTNAHSA